MLEFRNVSVSCQHMPILNDISLTFRDGEITTILGPNGCGKTTLVQCLNGASTVTAGQIFLNGQDFLKISPKERAREVSLLPQVRTIIPVIPVKMLVEHGRFPYLGFSRRKSKEDTEIVNRAMEFTHISQYADQYVDTLSGGIRQRVFFAMVLAQDCDYIVLDEPTAMLDPNGRADVIRTAHELNQKKGVTIILITHYMEEVVGADKVIVMDKGKVVMQGTPREIFSQVGKLKEYRLDVPQVTILADLLRQSGLDIPLGVLTREELVGHILRIAQIDS